jgi:HD-GYP domain-containing protein (c-di-GMP phosphodiesterase class II)
LITLADVVEVYHRAGGVDAAIEVSRKRSGSQFDPELVRAFCSCAPELFDELDSARNWDAVIAFEPGLDRWLSEAELDAALIAIAEFTDLKSPWLIGHSSRVAALVKEAANAIGEADAKQAWRAALVQDLGRLGVSNAIWDKPAALSHAETEQARLHVYFTERMLAGSAALKPLGALAAAHHERLDGSGYPRGLSGASISPAGRLLAAADVYCALTAERPHRPAFTPEHAAEELRAEVRAGRLDGAAVEAVLDAGGHRTRARREWPAGLTDREVEVLALLARGMSSKQIAERLVIAPKTARNHIEHIYSKIEVSNRAMASLFAARHGLATEDFAPL